MNTTGKTTRIANWSRTHRWAGKFAQPETETELCEIVAAAGRAGARVRVFGAAHSWSDTAATESNADTVVSLDRLNRVLNVDRARMEVTIQAGMRLFDLVEVLAREGLALENTGTILKQSFAGAISTGTHGTGIAFGNLATQVARLRLVLASGETLDLARGDERFPAALVSLGALGIIAQATIRVVPAFRLHGRIRKEPLDQVLEELPARLKANDHFKIWWPPHQATAWVWEWNRTEEPVRTSAALNFINDTFMPTAFYSVWLAFLSAVPALLPRANPLLNLLFNYRERVDRSDRISTYPALVRHQEMAYNFDQTRAAEGVRAVRAAIDAGGHLVDFPIEIRFYRGDETWLSPGYGRDSCNITLTMYRRRAYAAYFRAIEELMQRDFEGRPHWGKHFYAPRDQIAARYPRWNDFWKLRAELDPEGRWLNGFLRRLM